MYFLMLILNSIAATAGRKKLLQQLRSIIGQNAAGDLGMVVEPGFRKQVDYAAAGPGFGVRRPVNQPRDPCMHDSAGAHDAGFERHV